MEETEQQFSGVGITMALEKDHVRVISTLEDMPAFRAGVQPGDYILKVEDRPIEELGSLDDISRQLRGAAGTTVNITFFRPSTGKEFTLSLVREDIPIQTLRGYRADAKTGKWDFLADAKTKIGYIRLTKFAQNTAKELDDAYHALTAQGAKGLVLDLRYNPGGLLDSGIAVAGRFIDEGLIVRTQGRAGVQSESYADGHDTYRPMLPLVVLVNEYSASAAEVLGGALQDHSRAVLVGTRTFGKGSVQNVIDLDGEGAIKLTIAYYYTPSGRLVHRLPNAKEWGLQPNVDSPMTPDQQIKLREEWSRIAGGTPPVILGEGGGPVIDIQLSRAIDILRGMLLARQGIDKAAR
jgi:carboxyl-terminal processing protease